MVTFNPIHRTPLDEWSALYLTTRNTHNRETPMSPAGFEPEIPESSLDSPLDGAATGVGEHKKYMYENYRWEKFNYVIKRFNGIKKYGNGMKRW